jgi:hypothetical protein
VFELPGREALNERNKKNRRKNEKALFSSVFVFAKAEGFRPGAFKTASYSYWR